MSKHESRVLICDGKRPDNEVIQEAVDWVSEEETNRSVTIHSRAQRKSQRIPLRRRWFDGKILRRYGC